MNLFVLRLHMLLYILPFLDDNSKLVKRTGNALQISLNSNLTMAQGHFYTFEFRYKCALDGIPGFTARIHLA